MKDSTSAIRNQMPKTQYREHSTPMFLTSSFTYESAEQAQAMFAGEEKGFIYSRFTNPNTSELIDKMCALEGTKSGVATASGMAAVFNTLAAHLQAGDHVVAAKSLFGNSVYILQHILPKWGVETTLLDIEDTAAWESVFKSNTKLVLIETPTNPGLQLIDMKWLADLSHQHDAMFVVDNCFATPILQKPIEFGADIIIHSATKWIDGQGRVLGGMVLGSEICVTPVYDFIRRTGAAMSPFNAWILSKSLETLEVRMERHCNSAYTLSQELEKHPQIEKVAYPFLPSHPQYELAKAQMTAGGGIVCVFLKGGQSEAFQFINALRLPSITANLGDSRTIVTHPSTTTHSKLNAAEQEEAGITSSMIRVSVGLEHISDILDDFYQALNSIK